MSELITLITVVSLSAAIGLGIYALLLRTNHKQTQLSLIDQITLVDALRHERDQAIQNSIRLEAELDSERKQVQHRIDSLNEAKEALTNQFKNLEFEQ